MPVRNRENKSATYSRGLAVKILHHMAPEVVCKASPSNRSCIKGDQVGREDEGEDEDRGDKPSARITDYCALALLIFLIYAVRSNFFGTVRI